MKWIEGIELSQTLLASRRKWIKETCTTTRGAPLTGCRGVRWLLRKPSFRLVSAWTSPAISGPTAIAAIALSTLETVLLLLMILHTTSHETDHDSSHGLVRDLRASEAPVPTKLATTLLPNIRLLVLIRKSRDVSYIKRRSEELTFTTRPNALHHLVVCGESPPTLCIYSTASHCQQPDDNVDNRIHPAP